MEIQEPHLDQGVREEPPAPPFILNGRSEVPYYAQVLDPATGRLHFPRINPPPLRTMDVAQEYSLDYTSHQTNQNPRQGFILLMNVNIN